MNQATFCLFLLLKVANCSYPIVGFLVVLVHFFFLLFFWHTPLGRQVWFIPLADERGVCRSL